MGFSDEIFEGSPLWARTLEKQQNKYTSRKGIVEPIAKVENHLADDIGKMAIEGGKGARTLAVVGDIALGGAIMAGNYATMYGVGKLFGHNRKDTNSLNSNGAINPI